MIKITTVTAADGSKTVTEEFSDVDAYRSYQNAKTETRPAPTQIAAVVRPPETAAPVNPPVSRRRRGPTRLRTINPPIPDGRWPRQLYVTQQQFNTLQIFIEADEPLSSPDFAVLAGVDDVTASDRIKSLRTGTPLIEKVDGKYRLTVIGRDQNLKLQIHLRPGPKNRALNWNRFMGRPLSDGRPGSAS